MHFTIMPWFFMGNRDESNGFIRIKSERLKFRSPADTKDIKQSSRCLLAGMHTEKIPFENQAFYVCTVI